MITEEYKNFAKGFGSAFQLYVPGGYYSYLNKAPEEYIADYWQHVGCYVRGAIHEYSTQSTTKEPHGRKSRHLPTHT